MTNDERLEKLMQAQKLIRDVEFSYEYGDERRTRLYSVVYKVFSWSGILSGYMKELKEAADAHEAGDR